MRNFFFRVLITCKEFSRTRPFLQEPHSIRSSLEKILMEQAAENCAPSFFKIFRNRGKTNTDSLTTKKCSTVLRNIPCRANFKKLLHKFKGNAKIGLCKWFEDISIRTNILCPINQFRIAVPCEKNNS